MARVTNSGGDISGPEQRSKLADLADLTDSTAAPAAAAARPAEASRTASTEEQLAAARREFAVLLGEFRRTAVLVPFDAYGSLWTADQNGVRWICAFSDEEALARFAQAQGDSHREWTYRTILGARLLDVMVPMLPMPAGVALDAGSDEGMLFPPVEGIVPDSVAVDLGGTE
ncbi:SseB family protein [Streptomyces lunaelactis]|uniref:SseB family protein n=1 Tax=Streptomyces lunaelactis TaxID=1535768 RepID=UPI0015849D33|nr:SseB family protein [Streptomyces lunaelactis]NUL13207.1 SseB family protein [Streptomyces lunaelactis]NUL25877.1 SseB family protein [Streptomyces lunaelactis]